jgi:hypothetical protein
MGWLREFPASTIERAIENVKPALDGKTDIIFSGIGGSGNGIKALAALFKNENIFVIDSLDPAALEAVISKIKNKRQALIVPISKSGTTKETQLTAGSFREYMGKTWKQDFLWLADPEAFSKLDSAGWEGTRKTPIQCDGESDIGGRFSCPHTLIFYLPLYLFLNRDLGKVEATYSAYRKLLPDIRKKAYDFTKQYADKNPAYLCPMAGNIMGEEFFAWVVQLFQESLGSKRADFSVKTLYPQAGNSQDILPLALHMNIENPVVSLMAHMYFFQVFTAFYAAFKKLNYVDQPYVEKYKKEMRKLEGAKAEEIPSKTLDEVIAQAKAKMKPAQKFVEAVLYFYPKAGEVDSIRKRLSQAFSGKKVLVFIGSDWNHHSYQAAASDAETFFLILPKAQYIQEVSGVSKETLASNVAALELVARATYVTISDKAVLYRLSTID